MRGLEFAESGDHALGIVGAVAEEGGGGGDQRGEALAVAGQRGGVLGEAAKFVAQGLIEVVELARAPPAPPPLGQVLLFP